MPGRDAAERLTAETGSSAVQTDSADRDAVIARAHDSGLLDVLVVNSGFAIFGNALEQDPDEIDRLFRVNVPAHCHASSRRRGGCRAVAASSSSGR